MAILTVPQLAEKCAPLDGGGNLDADRLRLWVRRLRHWTVLGILPPAADNGRDLVYISAILLRIAEPGLSAPLIKSISRELQEKIGRRRSNFSKFWREATKFPRPFGIYHYLIVRITEDRTASTVGISRTNRHRNAYFGEFDPKLDTAIIVNLNEVFRVVQA
jgi:hypothetical protein